MRTQLVVPRFLRLVTDGFLNGVVVGGSMFHIVIATHSILLVGIEFGLKNVREHLDVETTSTVTF